MSFIRNKIPAWDDIAPVYGVAVLIIYVWSLLNFYWRLPSWYYYTRFGQIATYLMYQFSINLLESLMVIFPIILLSLALPRKLFLDRFVSRGTSLVMLVLVYLIYGNLRIPEFPIFLFRTAPVFLVVLLGATMLIDRFQMARNAMEEFAQRARIFIYVSLPISLFALFIILVRNIS